MGKLQWAKRWVGSLCCVYCPAPLLLAGRPPVWTLCGPVLLATPVPGACAIAASGVPVSQHLSRAPEKSTPSVSALHGTKALIKRMEDTEHDALT